jgi:pyruvate-ferredoxin/flavodoxin oxidoreductase
MQRILVQTIEGNEAVAAIAYRINEVIAIYPITPASPMSEFADAWSAAKRPNIWGAVPEVIEMQSEAGAAAVVHGALQAGSLSTTFTASQGLLLMIPNLFKIAGELTPFVLHVAARTVATHALSIFGDHSDVMAARSTGFAMLCAGSVQEAQDFALIAQAITLESRVPVLFFFDGFRTSHEIAKIELIPDEVIRSLISEERIAEHRARALTPDRPVLRGTAQNPDVFFQARERINPFYNACPGIAQNVMDRFAELTGRQYHLFDYHGAPDAERVLVMMGSGSEAAQETVDQLNAAGAKTGLLRVRLYRPFDVDRFFAALPPSTRALAILDRTKEPGSCGEPLYLDCVNALSELGCRDIDVIGGRYGLASKEFTPSMAKAVFDHMASPQALNHFTVGIQDDVSHTSLPVDESFSTEADDVFRAVFYGLGSDGTVGANKETIKLIGEHTPNFAQGYFVYDSKKAGAMTISHLRFGPRPIHSTYLITSANFVACHQPQFLDRYPVADHLKSNGTFLLNAPWAPESVWEHLPPQTRKVLLERNAHLYVIDAFGLARECGLGGRINTIMQTCFFGLTDILPREEAIDRIRDSIRKLYEKKGGDVVDRNLRAVDSALSQLREVPLPVSTSSDGAPTTNGTPVDVGPETARLQVLLAGRGDRLPVSALPVDGTFPTGTARLEKRRLAQQVPVWDQEICIQCGKCVFACPHSVIRSKVYEPRFLAGAPEGFRSHSARLPEWKDLRYTLQIAAEDCTGCGICIDVCPVRHKSVPKRKAINLEPIERVLASAPAEWEFFEALPDLDRRRLQMGSVRETQICEPLFEFSGACAGCGETPYIRLLTQLFGDRLLIANATGCSSIYGGNLPTTPYTKNREGRGPAWSNSLFEDNAEFGLGFRLGIDRLRNNAEALLRSLSVEVSDELVREIIEAQQISEADIFDQRTRVTELKKRLEEATNPAAKQLLLLADYLVRKSVWIVGGDGWAYDIGFGGLDHVLASGQNVKLLVLDTEVYSNTGGQSSKATPRAAVAKFASGGKRTRKKDLGLIAMSYGNVYVASVAMGAKDEHTLRAFLEAESYDGPALIIAYSHCIAHGINMATAMQNQKAAVQSGQWLLYRYNPDRRKAGENPLTLDSTEPKLPVEQYFQLENRFRMLGVASPEVSRELAAEARADVLQRWAFYQWMAGKTAQPAEQK